MEERAALGGFEWWSGQRPEASPFGEVGGLTAVRISAPN